MASAEQVKLITATVYSTDQTMKVEFDAEPWFTQASDDQIIALGTIDFGGAEAPRSMVEFFQDKDPKITRLFEYLATDSCDEEIGFKCYVNIDEAMSWLRDHKTYLFNEILRVNTSLRYPEA